MAASDDLRPLIDNTIRDMSSNEFTTYDFMTTFARFQEKEYVKALHEHLDHPAGPFGAVKEVIETLLEANSNASMLRDGARAIDMFGLPATTKLWQRKDMKES